MDQVINRALLGLKIITNTRITTMRNHYRHESLEESLLCPPPPPPCLEEGDEEGEGEGEEEGEGEGEGGFEVTREDLEGALKKFFFF